MRLSHVGVRNWYRNSLTGNYRNNFNISVVVGAYCPVPDQIVVPITASSAINHPVRSKDFLLGLPAQV